MTMGRQFSCTGSLHAPYFNLRPFVQGHMVLWRYVPMASRCWHELLSSTKSALKPLVVSVQEEIENHWLRYQERKREFQVLRVAWLKGQRLEMLRKERRTENSLNRLKGRLQRHLGGWHRILYIYLAVIRILLPVSLDTVNCPFLYSLFKISLFSSCAFWQ